MKYFLFFLIGFFVGRITMAIQYAFFKDLASSKGKDFENKLKGKINKISLSR
jgi:uncharacterized membrane protein SpoIIM required for sporulation|tara:strand:+ start:623 stop:778 length:156 start_codon:yes stop_codon:yes gene_type:complete